MWHSIAISIFSASTPDNVPPPRKRKRGDPPPRPPQEIEQAFHRLMATASRKLPEADTLTDSSVRKATILF